MLSIAGNKDDLYENEEVDEDEGTKLASEYNAIFQLTSAKDPYGIDDLFGKIGKKFWIQRGGIILLLKTGKIPIMIIIKKILLN